MAVTSALAYMTSGGVAAHSLRSYDQGHIPLETSALGSGLLVAQTVMVMNELSKNTVV